MTAQIIRVSEEGSAVREDPPAQVIDFEALFPNTKELSTPATRAQLAPPAARRRPQSRFAELHKALSSLRDKSIEALREQ